MKLNINFIISKSNQVVDLQTANYNYSISNNIKLVLNLLIGNATQS
jgi:hypothetical protein